MGMMIYMMNDGGYMTNGTSAHVPSQPFRRMADSMAAVKAYLKTVAAMILERRNSAMRHHRIIVPLV